MIKIKAYFRFIPFFLGTVFLIICALCAVFSKAPLENKRDYTVANRWKISDFRHIDLSLLEGKDRVLISYTLCAESDYLAFKSRGYNISAFVSGKMLYRDYSPESEKYHFIPVDTLKKGSVIMLRLIPCSRGGKILSDAVISTKSGLFQKLCLENQRELFYSFLFFISSLHFLLKIKKKRSRLRGANLFIILFSLGFIILLKSDFSFLLFEYKRIILLKALALWSLLLSLVSLLYGYCNAAYERLKLLFGNSDNVA
ncbi:MAG: hypothetical protein IJT65_05950 [Eubacterium sp.]|nr:hypothetical protein [Eubacterium sp.]